MAESEFKTDLVQNISIEALNRLLKPKGPIVKKTGKIIKNAISDKLFELRYKDFIHDSIQKNKGFIPNSFAEYKALYPEFSKAYDKIGKWDFLKKPSFYTGPLSKAATVGSKLIGPLQYMLPGKLHSGELTEEQIRGVHHPNASIWG